MTDRAREIKRNADEATAEVMQRIHESGELSHLYGSPLQLDDDPEWLATKMLKQQGFSHPLIERRRELEEPREAAVAIANKLRTRRLRLTRIGYECSVTEMKVFNAWRADALKEYRARLESLSRATRDYNLQAPEALQQRPIAIDDAMATISLEVPPIEPAKADANQEFRRPPIWRRLRPRL